MSGNTTPTEAEVTSAGAVAWVPFSGTIERRGALLRLTAAAGNGAIDLEENDVGSTPDGRLFVRKGAIIRHVEEPRLSDTAARPERDAVARECPTGITCCVGSVLICCADFKVIGSGAGAWGCERAFLPGSSQPGRG